MNELKSGRLVFVFVFQKVVGARIDIRVWVEFMNPVKRRNKQDSSDLMKIGKEESKLTLKNLNLGKRLVDFWQK